jgi:hypothetical protein
MARATKSEAPATPAAFDPSPIPQADARVYQGGSNSAVVVPDLAQTTERAPLPKVIPKPAFVLAWHIRQWIVMAGKLIPALRSIPLQEGLSRVSRAGRGAPINIADMRAHQESRGWRLLPHNLGPGGSYMRKTQVDPDGMGRVRGEHHHTAWQQYYPGTDRCRTDEAGYAAWCRKLVDDGRIPDCPEVVALGMAERLTVQLRVREQQLAKGAESLRPMIEVMRADLRVLNEHIDRCAELASPVDSEMVDVPDVG